MGIRAQERPKPSIWHVARFHMGTATATRRRAVDSGEILRAMKALPPFPAVALRAVTVLSGTDTSLKELCDVVRCDPAFTAEIIRVANSPLIAFSREITSILQATMLLGFKRLRKIVVTVGLRSYMHKSFAPATQACWRHSVACAMIAERIAKWNCVDRDVAYTSGILHDIGSVALDIINPEVYSELFDQSQIDPGFDLLQNEREAFGLDHCEAGRILIQQWKLPDYFIETTCFHHQPLTHEENAAEVIRLSCRLADALDFAAIQRPGPNSTEILAEFPEGVRKHMPNLEELAAEIAQEISVIEAG